MKLFKSRVGSVVDIDLLKWCCILLGMIAGACSADVTGRFVGIMALAAILAGIKPTVSCLQNRNAEP